MQNESDNRNKAEEPNADYSQNRLKFFSSFEEEQEAQLNYWRSLTPEERIAQCVIISGNAFAHVKKSPDNRLNFD